MNARMTQTFVVFVAVFCLNANAGEMTGRIVNKDDLPISRVSVSLTPVGPTGRQVLTTSDANGRFELTDLDNTTYYLRVSKNGWIDNQLRVEVTSDSSDANVDAVVTMRLTTQSKVLGSIQLGSLMYLLGFGIVVLIFNYFMVPEPSKGVAATGFTIVGLVIAISLIKTLWVAAATFTLIGGVVTGLIRHFGLKVANTRLQIEQDQRQQADAADQEERTQIASLVGENGVTTTDLRSCGRAKFGERIVEVRARRGFIGLGTSVIVIEIEGRTPIVDCAS